jgi:hypothetical protein
MAIRSEMHRLKLLLMLAELRHYSKLHLYGVISASPIQCKLSLMTLNRCIAIMLDEHRFVSHFLRLPFCFRKFKCIPAPSCGKSQS